MSYRDADESDQIRLAASVRKGILVRAYSLRLRLLLHAFLGNLFTVQHLSVTQFEVEAIRYLGHLLPFPLLLCPH